MTKQSTNQIDEVEKTKLQSIKHSTNQSNQTNLEKSINESVHN